MSFWIVRISEFSIFSEFLFKNFWWFWCIVGSWNILHFLCMCWCGQENPVHNRNCVEFLSKCNATKTQHKKLIFVKKCVCLPLTLTYIIRIVILCRFSESVDANEAQCLTGFYAPWRWWMAWEMTNWRRFSRLQAGVLHYYESKASPPLSPITLLYEKVSIFTRQEFQHTKKKSAACSHFLSKNDPLFDI